MPRLAHFCPELIHEERRANRKFRSEVRFYDALGRQLPQGWHVFYSVGWLNRLKPESGLRDGEADFVVAHPHHGVLIIEVKGGGIAYDGPHARWTSTDAQGIVHKIKNPFQQAKGSKHTLIEKLRERPGLEYTFVQVHHAVAFPDCDRPAHKINEEAYPEIIIGLQDVQDLPERLTAILKHSRGKETVQQGKDVIDALHFLLCRSVTLDNPLRSQIESEKKEIQTLTEAQIEALAILQRGRRVALGGGAGSGKTWVAVHKARDLAAQGFRTLLTCHSPYLARYLQSLVANTPNLRALSAYDLVRELVPGVDPAPANPDKVYAEALFDAMTAATEKPFDAILVDEGQDFTPDWWTALESCLSEGKKSIFYVCHDTNNQVVRPGGGHIPDDLFPADLRDNVRNTRNICQTLLPHYKGEVALRPHGPPGRAVEYHSCTSESELKQKLGTVLQRLLLVENLLARDIVVLTPRDPSKDSALPGFGLPQGIKLVTDETAVKGRSVLCASIEAFKGLERPVVLVAELDERLPADEKERAALLYVAFSRPRNLLVVFHSPDATDWVQAAPAS